MSIPCDGTLPTNNANILPPMLIAHSVPKLGDFSKELPDPLSAVELRHARDVAHNESACVFRAEKVHFDYLAVHRNNRQVECSYSRPGDVVGVRGENEVPWPGEALDVGVNDPPGVGEVVEVVLPRGDGAARCAGRERE